MPCLLKNKCSENIRHTDMAQHLSSPIHGVATSQGLTFRAFFPVNPEREEGGDWTGRMLVSPQNSDRFYVSLHYNKDHREFKAFAVFVGPDEKAGQYRVDITCKDPHVAGRRFSYFGPVVGLGKCPPPCVDYHGCVGLALPEKIVWGMLRNKNEGAELAVEFEIACA